jgi:ribosomal protein S30
MKKSWLRFLTPAALIGALALPALGQTTQSRSPDTIRTPRINTRQVRQQHRIAQGVRSGQLTPTETRRLERQQARIQADKLQAKADGNMTPRERARLTHEQNRASRNVYRLKHNNRVQKQ